MERNEKIKRPRGIRASLPVGMDSVVKNYLDAYRIKNLLPPELYGIPGKPLLFSDAAQLERWRNWRTGLKATVGAAILSGALDDLLFFSDGTYGVFDIKTRASPPPGGYSEKYYQRQADCYALLLRANGMTPNPKAYFLYYSPDLVEAGGIVLFRITLAEIGASPERAIELVNAAVTCLSNPFPPQKQDCEYCAYLNSVENLRVGSQKST